MCFQIKDLEANKKYVNREIYVQELLQLQYKLHIPSKIMAGHFNSVLTAFVLIVHYRLNNNELELLLINWDENVLTTFHTRLNCHISTSLVLDSDRRIINDIQACDVVCSSESPLIIFKNIGK